MQAGGNVSSHLRFPFLLLHPAHRHRPISLHCTSYQATGDDDHDDHDDDYDQ